MRRRKVLKTKLFGDSPTSNTAHGSSIHVPETGETSHAELEIQDDCFFDDTLEGEALEELVNTNLENCNFYIDDDFSSLGDRFFHTYDGVRSKMLSPVDKLLQSATENETRDSPYPVVCTENKSEMNNFASMDSTGENFLQEVLRCEPESTEPPLKPIRNKTKKRRRKTFYSSRKDRQARRKESDDTGKRIKGKGLRHISMSVTKKVMLKGRTTYEKVANEVIGEYIAPNDPRSGDKLIVAKKNIRRRVYDTLNVLNALDLVSTRKREVRWLNQQNVPTKSQNLMMKDKVSKLENILEMKNTYLQELGKKTTGLQNLIDRNQMICSAVGCLPLKHIMLPFTLVEIPVQAVVEWKWSDDTEVFYIDSDRKLPIHDDQCVIKALEKSKNGPGVQYSQSSETLDFEEDFLVKDLMMILSNNEGEN